MKLPNFELAFIDRNKLQNYSLNAQHNRGKHKARLFAAILDLGSDDAEILQLLIQDAIQNYEAVPSLLDEYGQRYIVDFPITRNQNTASALPNKKIYNFFCGVGVSPARGKGRTRCPPHKSG